MPSRQDYTRTQANINAYSRESHGAVSDTFDAMRHVLLDCITFGMPAEMLEPLLRRAECIEHATVMLTLARDGFEAEFITGKNAKVARRISQAVRGEVEARDGRRCVYCGNTEGPFHLDHVKPVSAGGDGSASNLVVACAGCNMSKGAKPLRQWRRK